MSLLLDHFINVSNPIEPKHKEFHKLARKAEVFLFDDDAYAIWLQSKDKIMNTNKKPSFSRLPYPVVWVEVHSPVEEAAIIGYDWIGCMYIAQNIEGTVWKYMQMQRQVSDGHLTGLPIILIVDIEQSKYEIEMFGYRDGLDAKAELELTRLCSHLYMNATYTLALLNCKNLFEPEATKQPAYQREHRHMKKYPFVDYKLLKLKLTNTQRNAAKSHGMNEQELRAHMVRGHFKRRKSGVYWWSPFIRGNEAHGKIVKDYIVNK
jgi:hypothetical protein